MEGLLTVEPVAPALFVLGQVVVAGRGVLQPPFALQPLRPLSGGDSRRSGRCRPSGQPGPGVRGAARGSRSCTARSGSQLWRGTGQAMLPNPKRFPSRSRRPASSSPLPGSTFPPAHPHNPESGNSGPPPPDAAILRCANQSSCSSSTTSTTSADSTISSIPKPGSIRSSFSESRFMRSLLRRRGRLVPIARAELSPSARWQTRRTLRTPSPARLKLRHSSSSSASTAARMPSGAAMGSVKVRRVSRGSGGGRGTTGSSTKPRACSRRRRGAGPNLFSSTPAPKG